MKKPGVGKQAITATGWIIEEFKLISGPCQKDIMFIILKFPLEVSKYLSYTIFRPANPILYERVVTPTKAGVQKMLK